MDGTADDYPAQVSLEQWHHHFAYDSTSKKRLEADLWANTAAVARMARRPRALGCAARTPREKARENRECTRVEAPACLRVHLGTESDPLSDGVFRVLRHSR